MTTLFSKCHGGRLLPVDWVYAYSHLGARALVTAGISGMPCRETPGSLRCSQTAESQGDSYSVEISYTSTDTGEAHLRMLRHLSRCRMLFIYHDARDIRRVSGSPSFPLRLSYSVADGVVSVKLSGRAPWPDPALDLR